MSKEKPHPNPSSAESWHEAGQQGKTFVVVGLLVALLTRCAPGPTFQGNSPLATPAATLMETLVPEATQSPATATPEPTPPPATETPAPEATPETLPAEGEIWARFVNPATIPEIPTGDPNRVTFGYEFVLHNGLRLNEYWDISNTNLTLKKLITPQALQKMEIGGAEYTRGQESEQLIVDHADYIIYYYLQHQAAFNAVAAKNFAGYPDLTQYHSLAQLQANPKWQAWEASLASTDLKVNPLAGMTEKIALKIEEQFLASITDAQGDFDWDKFHAWQTDLKTNPEGQSVVLFGTYEAPDGSYKQGFHEFNWARQNQITTITTDNADLNPGTQYLHELKFGTVFTKDGIVFFWSNYYGCAKDALEGIQIIPDTEENREYRADITLTQMLLAAELSISEDNPYSRFFLANYERITDSKNPHVSAFFLLRDFLQWNLTNDNNLDFYRNRLKKEHPSLWIPVNSPEDIGNADFIPFKFTPSSNK